MTRMNHNKYYFHASLRLKILNSYLPLAELEIPEAKQ
jgi:hypothetical protein